MKRRIVSFCWRKFWHRWSSVIWGSHVTSRLLRESLAWLSLAKINFSICYNGVNNSGIGIKLNDKQEVLVIWKMRNLANEHSSFCILHLSKHWKQIPTPTFKILHPVHQHKQARSTCLCLHFQVYCHVSSAIHVDVMKRVIDDIMQIIININLQKVGQPL